MSKRCDGIWYSEAVGLYPKLPISCQQTIGIGRPNDGSDEWHKAVTINADCPEKVRYFADKLSTKMVEESVAAVSRELLDRVRETFFKWNNAWYFK
jgi:hypothetical protein